MDDHFRHDVEEDIRQLREGDVYNMLSIANHSERLMTDYDRLELQMLQAKKIIGAICEAHSASWETTDIDFALISAGKDFLEENP